MNIIVRLIDSITIKAVTNMLTRRYEAEVYKLVAGDTLPKLKFEAIDDDDNPKDLTGYDVKFFLKKYGESGHLNVGHEDCTVTNATAGYFEYEWTAGDITGEGLHYGEVEFTKDGKTATLQEIVRFDVRPQVG